MSNGGDAADQMARTSIEAAEAVAKLSAEGAKNLVALTVAAIENNPQLAGKTHLKRILREGKELKVLPMRAADLKQFKREAEQYGVLFTAVKTKTNEGEFTDILVKAEDVGKINRILERMGYPVPELEAEAAKKEGHSNRSEKDWNGAEFEKGRKDTDRRETVHTKLNRLDKEYQKETARIAAEKNRVQQRAENNIKNWTDKAAEMLSRHERN